jgi:hypothetical protein
MEGLQPARRRVSVCAAGRPGAQGRISEIQPAAEDVGGQREYRVRIALAKMPARSGPPTGRA